MNSYPQAMRCALWILLAGSTLFGALWSCSSEDSNNSVHDRSVTEPSLEAPKLSGTILDKNGAALEEVLILATQDAHFEHWPLDSPAWEVEQLPSRSTRTTSEGRFEFRNLNPGRVRFSIRSPEHSQRELGWTRLATGQDRELEPITLEQGPKLTLRVLTDGGKPLAAANVLLVRPEQAPPRAHAWTGSFVGQLGSNGEFSTTQLESGPFRLGIHSHDFPVRWIEGDLISPLDLGDIQMAKPDTIRSQVAALPLGDLDDIFLAAIPVASMPYVTRPSGTGGFPARWLDGYTTSALRNGDAYLLDALQPGVPYCLRAICDGDDFRITDAWSEPIVIGSDRNETVLEVHPSVRMDFHVADARTGLPLDDFESRWEGARSLKRKGIDYLRATSSNLRATLIVDAPGFQTYRSEPFAFVSAEPLNAPRIELEAGSVVKLHVLSHDQPDGIANATACLTELDTNNVPKIRNSSYTDPEGRAILNDTPGPTRILSVEAAGYASSISKLDSTAGEPRIVLSRGGSVTVHVTNSAGIPLPGIPVRCTPNDAIARALFPSRDQVQYTDKNGLVCFASLSEGSHGVYVCRDFFGTGPDPWNAPSLLDDLPRFDRCWPSDSEDSHNHSEEAVEVSIREGQSARIALITTAPRELRGKLTQDGMPLAGAVVRAYPSLAEVAFFDSRSNPFAVTRADSEGLFVLRDIPAESVTLFIEHGSRCVPAVLQVQLKPQLTLWDHNFDSITLRGLVLNSEGEPVSGAAIHLPKRWKREARFGPALGPGDKNMLAWSETELSPAVTWTNEAGRFELSGTDGAGPLELLIRSEEKGALVRCGTVRVSSELRELTAMLSSDSKLYVEDFEPKPTSRLLGVSWRWGRDPAHPVQLLEGQSGETCFGGLSADEWTVFQCELDGWGEIRVLRVLTPALVGPVGDARVGIHR